MVQKTLICYKFEKMDSIKRKQFDRELFGTIEKSHGGKYVTKTKGYLSDKKFRRPVKSTILVEKNYIKRILEILNKYSATYELFKVLQ